MDAITTTTFILVSIALFVTGILVGWVLARTRGQFKTNDLQLVVGVLVTVVWVVSIAAEIVIPAYTVSALIHGIMGGVVGYLFSDDGLTLNLGGDNNE